MFNKKLYTIFIVLFILLVGLSVAAATDTNNTKTQEVKDTVNTKQETQLQH